MKNTLRFCLQLTLLFVVCTKSLAQYYPGGFSKSKINLWLDASDTTTFTKVGGVISAWKDKANNLSAAQATSSKQPALSVQDGKNIVEFNGAQGLDIATNALLAPQNGYNVAQVIHVYPDAPSSLTDFRYGTYSNSTNNTQGTPLIGLRYVTQISKYAVTAMRNNTYYYYTAYNDLRGQWLMAGNYLPSTGINTYYYFNGGGTLNSTDTPHVTNTTLSTTIGNRTNNYSSVHWGVSETVLAGFDTKKSGRRIIETYLAAKWGMLDTFQTYNGAVYFYPTNAAFVNDLVGIGTEGGSDSTTYTGSNNGLGFQNVNGISGLLRAPGTYLTAADNGISGTTTMGTSFTRWNRSWYVNKTDPSGYGGLVNIFFDFNSYSNNSLDTNANDYYILYNPTSGYFNSGTNYLVNVNSYKVVANTQQLYFQLDGLNISNGFYTIVYAPKGSATSSIPRLANFNSPSISISPAPTISSVFSGNTYNYILIDSSNITYPVAYYKIYASINGATSTVVDSTIGTPKYYAHYHLTNGNTYNYTISAVYAPGKESGLSNAFLGSPNQFKPSWGTLPQYAGSQKAYMSASLPAIGLPIKFSFQNVTNNSHSSGYQTNSYYNDSLLSNNTSYTYQFKFIDTIIGVSSESSWSDQKTVLIADSVQGGFTYNLSFLDPSTIWAPNGIGPATDITPATEDMTSSGLRMVQHAAPVGQHPRVFINPGDSTNIRWRLSNTYSGKSAAHWIHAYTTMLNVGYGTTAGRFTGTFNYNAYYNLDTLGNQHINNGGSWNVQPYYNYLAAGDTSTNSNYNYSTLWNGQSGKMTYLFAQEAMECWLYRNQNDPATGINYATRATKLANAITTWAKKALANTTTPLTPNNASQFGGANMYYVYDFLYDQMTKNQQDTVRMALMKMLPDSSAFHGMEAPSYTTTTNWQSFPQGVTYFFAVEGEPGYTAGDTTTVNLYMRGLWNFLTYGVYSQTGNVYEGLGKDQLDVPDLYAAAKRGYSMLGHPSVKNYGKKYLPAIVQPFGYSFLGTDLLGGTQSNNYSFPQFSSPSTGGWRAGATDIIGLKWIFPNDTAIDYVWKNYMQRPLANYSPYNPTLSPNYYFYTAIADNYGNGVGGGSYFNTRLTGLLFASDYLSASLPTEAQAAFGGSKMYFDSLGGFATLRSGFDSTATTVYFANRQDMGGHTYANKNEVVLSALGRIWFPRPSSDANSMFDALAATGVGSASGILVNNYGATLDTTASSADGGNLSVPGKVIYYQNNNNMLSIAGDATIPYSYKWYGQFGGWTGANPNLSPPNITAVPFSPNSFRYASYYSFDNTSYYHRLSYSDQAFTQPSYLRYVQKASTPNGIYKKMFRTVSLIQGAKPFVVIADDNQLNASTNNYRWFCQLPTDVTLDNTVVNLSNTNYQNDVILKETTGNRRLLLRVLNNTGAISNTVPGYIDNGAYALSGLNRLIVESNSVNPQFKVMLFAYNLGDALPTTNWNSDRTRLYVTIGSVADTIGFDLDASGRTGISLNPVDSSVYWVGGTDSLWNTASNWSSGSVPTASTKVIIPFIDPNNTIQPIGTPDPSDISTGRNASLVNTPYVGNGVVAYAKTLSVQTGGILHIDTTLQLSGDLLCSGTIYGNGSLKTIDTSQSAIPTGKTWLVNIEYNNSDGRQFIASGTYAGLSINNSIAGSLNTALGNVVVNGNINIGAGDTLNMSSNTLTGTSVTSTGTGVLETQSTSSSCLPANVTWAGVVVYNNGLGGQTIVGGTYQDLVITTTNYKTDNASGIINVVDTFNIGSKATFDLGTYQLGGSLNYNTGSGTLKTASTAFVGALPSNKTWAGSVVYYSSSNQVVAPGIYNNLDISGGVNGPRSLDVTGGTGTINLTGSFASTTGTVTPNLSTVAFTGNLQQVPAISFYNLDLTGATVTTFSNAGTTYINGTFTPANITTAGGLGTINFSGVGYPQLIPSFNYNNLTVSGSNRPNNVTLGANIGLTGNLSFAGLSFTTGSLNTTDSNTTVRFIGTAAQTIDGSPSGNTSFAYFNIVDSNLSSTLTAVNNLSISNNLKLVTGATLDMGTYALGGSLTFTGGVGNTGTIKTQNTTSTPLPTKLTYPGIVKYNSTTGTQTIVAGNYTNLDISGGTTGSRTLINGDTIYLAGNYTVNTGTGSITTTNNTMTFNGTTSILGSTSLGNVLINTSSTLTAPASTLNVSGNFTNNGTFNASTGMINLNGSKQTIVGSNNFNKLTKIVAINDTLYLPAGVTQTINDSLVLKGSAGNILTLLSSIDGTQAQINPIATRTISFVAVKDNLNTNTTAIATTNCYNFTDNTNWTFGPSTYNWIGAVDATWGNASNWNPALLPGTTDSVIVSKTSTTNLSIEANETVVAFTINSGNTVSLNANTLSVSGNFVNNGTLNGSTGTNTFAGTTTLSGTGTFNFNHVTINSSSTVTSSTLLTLNVAGNWTDNGSFTPSTSTVVFNGTSAQSIIKSGGETFNNISITNTAAAVNAASTINVGTTGVVTIATGATLNMATYQLGGGASLTTSGTGVLTTQSTLSTPLPTGRTWAFAVNYNNSTGGQTVMAGTYSTSLINSNTSNSNSASGTIIVNGSLVLYTGSVLDMLSNTLTAGSGFSNSGLGTIKTQGTFPSNKTWTGSVIFNSSVGYYTIQPGNYNNIDINGGVSGASRNMDAGAGNGTGTFTINGTMTCTNTSGVVFNKTTVNFAGNNQTIPAGFTFYNLGFTGTDASKPPVVSTTSVSGAFNPGIMTGLTSGTLTFSTPSGGGVTEPGQTIPSFNYYNLTISGTRTVNVALASSGSIGVAGALTLSASYSSCTFSGTGSTINMNGTAAQTFPYNSAGGFSYNNVTITNTSSNVTSSANQSIAGTLTVNNGSTLDMSTYTLAFGSVINNGTLKTSNISATPIPSNTTYGGTVTYASSSAQTIVYGTYNNLTASGGARTLDPTGTINIAGVYTPGSSTTVAGTTVNFNGASSSITAATSFNNLTIASSATLTAPAASINVSGTWTNNGSFTANNGTVVLNGGSQLIVGSTTFYNLTKSVVSAASLTFPSGQTQIINGTLTLSGALNNLLTINASTVGSQAMINPVGTRSISFVSVIDNNNINTTAIAVTNAYNYGDNINWSFGATTLTWLGTSDTKWNNTANWSPAIIPTSIDYVIVAKSGTNDLSLDISPSVATFTVNSGNTVSFNTQSLTLSGNYTNNGTVNAAAGTIVFAGTTTTSGTGTNNWGNVTINASSSLTAAALSTLYVAGNWNNSGTFTPSTSTINFNGTTAQTITKSGGETYNNLTISNTTASVLAGSNISVATSGVLNIASGAVLDMVTYQLPAGASLTTSGTGTLKTQYVNATTAPIPTGRTWSFNVTYNNTVGGQQVMAGTYNGGLTTICNTSGTKTANTASGNLAVAGTLSVTDSLNMGTYQLTGSFTPSPNANNLVLVTQAAPPQFPYNLTWPGTVVFNGAVNQRIIAGIYNNIDASIGGSKNLTDNSGSANNTIQVNGNFKITDGTTTYVNSSSIIFGGTNQVIPGVSYNNLSITGTGSTFGSSSAATFNVLGTLSPGTVTSANQGTINFNGTGSQTIPAFGYNNLTISAARTGTSTLTLASGTISVAGTFSDTHTGSFTTVTTTTDTLLLGSTQTFTPSTDLLTNLNVLGVSNGTVTIASGKSLTLNGLYLTGGTLANGSNTLTVNGNATATSGTLTSSSTGTVIYNQATDGQKVIAGTYGNLTFSNFNKVLPSTGTIAVAGTFTTGTATGHIIIGSSFDFNGSGAQTIPAFSYNNLTISGARTTNSVTLASGTINIAGNYNRSATFSTGSVTTVGNTVVFNGTSNQSITAATTGTFNNLTINNTTSGGGTVSLNTSNFTVNGSLILTSGLLALGSNNLTLANAASGATASSYIVATSTGKLIQNGVTTNGILLPIGTATAYAPITVTNTSGTSNITAGISSTITNAVVNANLMVNLQWSLLSSASTTTNVTYQFNSTDGASGFAPTNSSELGIYTTAYNFSSVGVPISQAGSVYTVTKTGLSLTASTAYLYIIGNTGTFCTPGSWIGLNQGDASLASNWCGFVVPTSTTDVIISNTTPKLTASLVCNNLALNSGIYLNGFNLLVSGSISGVGTFTGSPTSGLVIKGTGSVYMDQTTVGTTNVLDSFSINSNGTVTLANPMMVTNIVRSTNGVIASGGNLTLAASATGVARVPLSNGSISGNVTTQLFIPAKAARRWSFIGSATAQQISSAWQKQIYITGVGSGGTTCGSTTGYGAVTTDKFNTSGFDVTNLNTPSMYNYNVSKVNGSRWVSIPNTNATSLLPGTGYRLNIRGDRNVGSCADQLNSTSPTAPVNVVLSATGTLTQGNVTVNLNDYSTHLYTLVANPYQNQIRFSSFLADNSAITSKIWTYSPTGNGNYTTYSAATGIITNGATGYANANGDYIAIGQAFFVESNQTGQTITFKDAHKSDANIPNFNYFGIPNTQTIRTVLNSTANEKLDEVVVQYNNHGTKNYDNSWDAISFGGGNQTLATLKDATALSIASRSINTTNDTIPLRVKSTTIGGFKLNFTEITGFDSSSTLVLMDKYAKTLQDVKAKPEYVFAITNDTSSNGYSRFELVVKKPITLPVTIQQIGALQNDRGVAVSWKVANEINIASYVVEKSTDAIHFRTVSTVAATGNNSYEIEDASVPLSTVYYRVKVVGNDGAIAYSSVAMVQPKASEAACSIYPNPVKDNLNISFNKLINGKVEVSILTVAGIKVMSANKQVANNQLIMSVSQLAGGVYMLELTTPDGNKQLQKFVKE